MTQSLRDKVREETIRECIDVAKNQRRCSGSTGIVPALERMLPKPDRAAELVERWREREGGVFPEEEAGAESFARFLISEGIVL